MMRGAQSRRGAAYLVALLAGSIVTVTGLAALSIATSRAKDSILTDDAAEARLLATSGVEHATAAISALIAQGYDRNDLTSAFSQSVSMGSGEFAWSFTEVTGAPIDNVDGPIHLTADGSSGSARHRLRWTLVPSGLPYTCLGTAMYAGGTVAISSTGGIAADGVVGSRGDFSNLVGTVNAPVEAGGNVSGTLYLGATTSRAAVRDMPNTASTVDYYRNIGTAISYSDIPHDSGIRTLQNVLLSPTSNPFGPVNALGVYVIDLDSSRLLIRNLRVQGTLVLLRSSSDTLIGANVFMQPAHPWLATIVADGDLTFGGNGAGPNEAVLGVNLNPSGTPYQFAHDASTDDAYPGRIEGVVYATDDIAFTLLTQSFQGTIIAHDNIEVRTGASVNITYDPGVAHLPPFGFFQDEGGLAIDPASLTWTLP
jgi:hypothetical protein